ncbi:MAG TPA: tRNA-specific adenosine deaminase [Clostridiales bacterium]|jgi:tRNA(adenine34) deaminase|nr:tRNA-specific adenosine deaminase [Clostridiales bacterium]
MDNFFMNKALDEAYEAYELDEVPIGAVIVKDGRIIGKGYNRKEVSLDTTNHAEIMAIKEASKNLKNWRLTGCTMYVTVEPCPMCAGAIVNSRITELVIGTMDPKGGACGSLYNIVEDDRLNHRVEVRRGILEEECSNIMKDFFKKLR